MALPSIRVKHQLSVVLVPSLVSSLRWARTLLLLGKAINTVGVLQFSRLNDWSQEQVKMPKCKLASDMLVDAQPL